MIDWGDNQIRWLLKDLDWQHLEIDTNILLFLKAVHWSVEGHLETLASKLLSNLEIISEDIEFISTFSSWGYLDCLIKINKNSLISLFDRSRSGYWYRFESGNINLGIFLARVRNIVGFRLFQQVEWV